MGECYFKPPPSREVVRLSKQLDLFEAWPDARGPKPDAVWLLELASQPGSRAMAMHSLLGLQSPKGSMVSFVAEAVAKCCQHLQSQPIDSGVSTVGIASAADTRWTQKLLARTLPFVFNPPVTRRVKGRHRHPWAGIMCPMSVRVASSLPRSELTNGVLSRSGFDVVATGEDTDPVSHQWAMGIVGGALPTPALASTPQHSPSRSGVQSSEADSLIRWLHEIAAQQPWWAIAEVNGGFLQAQGGQV